MPRVQQISTLGGSIQTGEIDDAAVTFAKINSNANIHRKQFSDATERTTDATAFTDSGTAFTLAIPAGSLILGAIFRAEIKNTDVTDDVEVGLEFDGTNLGQVYARSIGRFVLSLNTLNNGETVVDGTESWLVRHDNNMNYVETAASIPPFKILDASTTITVRLRQRADTGGDAFVKNVTLDIIYIENFEEDT